MKIANEYIEKRIALAQLQSEIKDLEKQLISEMKHGSYTTPQGTVSLVMRTVKKIDPSVTEQTKAIMASIEPKIKELEESIKPAIAEVEEKAKQQGLITEEQVKSLRFTQVK